MTTNQLEIENNIKNDNYKETELDEWFRKNCAFSATNEVDINSLYNDYLNYCKERRTPSITFRKFTKEIPILAALNWRMRIIKGRNARGIMYRGLSLLNNIQQFLNSNESSEEEQ